MISEILQNFCIVYSIIAMIDLVITLIALSHCEDEICNSDIGKDLSVSQLRFVLFISAVIISFGWIITIPILLSEIFKRMNS